MIMSGGSSSSTAVNPPTPSLSSLASSTPPSSEYIYVNGNMTNTTPPMTTSYDTLQMSLVSLGQNVSLEEALIRVSDLMKENSDLKAVLQQNNHAMKEQCQVLASVKHQWAAEREEMKHKFEQTRDVILRLRRTVEEKENRLADLESQLSQKSNNVESLQEQIAEKDKVVHTAREEMDTTVDKITKDHKQQIEDLKTKMKMHSDYSEDVATLRAQVVSLVNELYDTEQRLKEANEDIERYKHSCTELQNRVRMQEAEVLRQRSREDKLNEDLRNRIARLEVTLRQEQEDKKRKEVSLQELRLNFDQLCNDYHELLGSHEDYKAEQKAAAKSGPPGGMTTQQRAALEEKLDNLTAQVFIAEEAITHKDQVIADLKSKLKKCNDDIIPVLRAQAEVYKRDFEDERSAREKLHAEKERFKEEAMKLREELEDLSKKNQRLEDRIKSLTGPDEVPPFETDTDPEPGLFDAPRPPSPPEPEDHICPMCQTKCPDLDTLKIHLTDCLDDYP